MRREFGVAERMLEHCFHLRRPPKTRLIPAQRDNVRDELLLTREVRSFIKRVGTLHRKSEILGAQAASETRCTCLSALHSIFR